MPKFPTPKYVDDRIEGVIAEIAGIVTLVVGHDMPHGAVIKATGVFTLRYGMQTIAPVEIVIPGLFVGERGGTLTGREAWDYLQERFQLHPRADIVGLNADGSPTQVLVKELDFGTRIHVFAYALPADTIPLCEVQALLVGEGTNLPLLLAEYLTV